MFSASDKYPHYFVTNISHTDSVSMPSSLSTSLEFTRAFVVFTKYSSLLPPSKDHFFFSIEY